MLNLKKISFYPVLNFVLLVQLLSGALYIGVSGLSGYNDYYKILIESFSANSEPMNKLHINAVTWFGSAANLWLMIGFACLSVIKEFLIRSLRFKMQWNAISLGCILVIALYVGFLESAPY